MTKKAIECSQKGRVAVVRLDAESFVEDCFADTSYALSDFCAEISSKEDVCVFAILMNAKKSFTEGKIGDAWESTGVPSPVDCISALQIPVIIGMDGYVLGEDLELALACDVRVAAPESYFGFPGIHKGYVPSQGGTQRLPRLVGKGMALEMILTGAVIDVNTSQRIGLVSRIAKGEKLNSEVMNMATEMSQKSPISLRYSKEAINKGMDLTLEQGIRLEADLYYLMHTTRDRSEGIRAFQEKRPPEFKGT